MSLLQTEWPTVPLGRLASINDQVLSETTDPDYMLRYIDIASVGRGELVEEPATLRFEDAPSRARRILRKGDTLVSTVRTYLRAVLPIRDDASGLIASTGFAVLSPSADIDSRFLSWYAQSDPFIEEVVARSVGVSYPAIAPSELARFPIPTPALAEQRAIADYLDAETARIDALIEKKRHLIEVLIERLDTAIEQHTWQLPGSERLQLRRVVTRFVDYRGATPVKADEGVPLVTASHIADGAIDLAREPQFLSRDTYIEWMRRGWPEHEDIVMTTEAPLGEVAQIVDTSVALAQRVILLKCDPSLVESKFLAYCLRARSFQERLKAHATGSTALGIKAERLRALTVPRPSLKAQRDSTQILKTMEESDLRLRNLLGKQIELLTEHRQALITAAVTGEVEV